LSLNIDFNSGGVAVLDRVIEAYGFTTKVALAEHLGIASSSLAMRYKRDYFPSDIVVKCMADTGATLEWLATGEGQRFANEELNIFKMPRHKIVDGQLFEDGSLMLGKDVFLPGKAAPQDPRCVVDGVSQHVVEQIYSEVYDGEWLVEIEGKISIRTLTRIPVQKVRISGSGVPFDCDLADIKIIGRIVLSIK